jgi:hypothetical protein
MIDHPRDLPARMVFMLGHQVDKRRSEEAGHVFWQGMNGGWPGQPCV